MTNHTKENTIQNTEQTTQQAESIAWYDSTINEFSQEILSTQTQIETEQIQTQTEQNIAEIKQDVNKQSFINYMKENWTPLESQSQEIQNLTQQILRPPQETELTKKQKKYNEIKSELVDSIKNNEPKKIISSVKKLLRYFLWSFNRRMNVGNNINYSPNENDKNFLINAITATLDPEKRSSLTYLLWKIKDEEIKENLKEKWIENPSQFQLFLQNCKPWQMLLTNAESRWPKRHRTFSKATQIVSWARRCHAAIISDIKEDNWIITDATIIQATWEWIHETSLKTYFNKEYKCADLLLWTFQPSEKSNNVLSRCKSYIWWKYSQVNLVADTIFDKVNPLHMHKQEKNKYCSELVFTWMQEAWLELPDPHTTPADLLSTTSINPEYCCYCDSF